MKRHHKRQSVNESEPTIADQLGDDVLAKLKEAKKQLKVDERAAEEKRREEAKKEREAREANKSFAELLEEYDVPMDPYK